MQQTTSTLAPLRAGTVARHTAVWMPIGFALAGIVVSALGSWIPSFWGDEAATAMSAQRSLPSLFMMLGHVDAVHGTYYLLMHPWVAIFGASPFALRLPSAIAIGAAIAGAVQLSRMLSSTRVAVIVGLVTLAMPQLTFMGEEARSFALSAAVVVWMTVLLVWLLKSPRSRLHWAAYSIILACSIYIFLFTILIIPVHAVAVYVFANRRSNATRFMAAVLASVVLSGPLLYWASREQEQIAYLSDRDAANPQSVLVSQWFGNDLTAVFGWTAIAIGIAATVSTLRRAGSVTSPRLDRRGQLVVIATALTVIPFATILSINFFHAIYAVRYLTFATPGVAILVALACTRPPRAWMTWLLVIAFVASCVPSYLQYRTPFAKVDSDWAQIASTISAHAHAGDAVVFDETTQISKRPRLAMRTYPEAFEGLLDVTLKSPYWKNPMWWDTTRSLRSASTRLSQIDIDRVWMIEYKAPGMPADSANLDELHDLGFSVKAVYHDHSSEIYELTRP